MFEYAFYKKLQIMGRNVRTDISWFDGPDADQVFYLLDAFPNIDLNMNGIIEEKKRMNDVIRNRKFLRKAFQYIFRISRWIVMDGHGQIYRPIYLYLKDRYFDGFWQSEKYWKKEKKEIINCFAFRDIENRRLRQLESICESPNSVSVHIRRGDYLDPKRNGLFTNICTDKYYQTAIQYIKQRMPDACFVIFTNDIEWVKENWHLDNSHYAADYLDEDLPDWIDMKLMSLCKNNIIANSTFSWWGAYLNQNPSKLVIAPNKWLNGVRTPDICPKEWIRL